MIKLMMITNNPHQAINAIEAGIDRIFIDLERNGKFERQGHLNTYISNHKITDIAKVKSVMHKGKLLVRINPIYLKSQAEIDQAINDGADILMLPMFKTKKEVEKFIKLVDGRAKTCLLLETSQAVVRLDDILKVKGIDEIHIGLNDLHLALGLDFMFELISNDFIENITDKIKEYNIPFGIGGIARIGEGLLPAEKIITEHYRLGSQAAILSRTFDGRLTGEKVNKNTLFNEVQKIRLFENNLLQNNVDFERNLNNIKKIVNKILEEKE